MQLPTLGDVSDGESAAVFQGEVGRLAACTLHEKLYVLLHVLLDPVEGHALILLQLQAVKDRLVGCSNRHMSLAEEYDVFAEIADDESWGDLNHPGEDLFFLRCYNQKIPTKFLQSECDDMRDLHGYKVAVKHWN